MREEKWGGDSYRRSKVDREVVKCMEMGGEEEEQEHV